MATRTYRSFPLSIIYHVFFLYLISSSIFFSGTRYSHHQANAQAPRREPSAGKQTRLVFRDLISLIPISPLELPVGYPQKMIAVFEDLDVESGDVVQTHLCYKAFNSPDDIEDPLVRFFFLCTSFLSPLCFVIFEA